MFESEITLLVSLVTTFVDQITLTCIGSILWVLNLDLHIFHMYSEVISLISKNIVLF